MGRTGFPERRAIDVEVDIRASDDGTRLFSGYAAVFNQWADIGGMFREQVAPGAFAKTIRQADIPFVFNHNPDTVMARTKLGTVRLSEDDKGLKVEADLDPADQDAARLITKLESRNVQKMSFAFRTIKDDWNEDGKIPERTLREAALFDVSPVTSPAYSGTSAQLRMEARAVLEANGYEVPEFEDELNLARALEFITKVSPEDGEYDPGHVRAAIDTLERFLLDTEPSTPNPEPDPSLSLDIAMRRLELRKRRAQAA